MAFYVGKVAGCVFPVIISTLEGFNSAAELSTEGSQKEETVEIIESTCEETFTSDDTKQTTDCLLPAVASEEANSEEESTGEHNMHL